MSQVAPRVLKGLPAAWPPLEAWPSHLPGPPVTNLPPLPTPGTTSICPTWSANPVSTSRAGGRTSAAASTTPVSWTTSQTSWSVPGVAGEDGAGAGHRRARPAGKPPLQRGRPVCPAAYCAGLVEGRESAGVAPPPEWLRPQSDPAPRSQEWAEGLRATQRGVWNSWPIGPGAP